MQIDLITVGCRAHRVKQALNSKNQEQPRKKAKDDGKDYGAPASSRNQASPVQRAKNTHNPDSTPALPAAETNSSVASRMVAVSLIRVLSGGCQASADG